MHSSTHYRTSELFSSLGSPKTNLLRSTNSIAFLNLQNSERYLEYINLAFLIFWIFVCLILWLKREKFRICIWWSILCSLEWIKYKHMFGTNFFFSDIYNMEIWRCFGLQEYWKSWNTVCPIDELLEGPKAPSGWSHFAKPAQVICLVARGWFFLVLIFLSRF